MAVTEMPTPALWRAYSRVDGDAKMPVERLAAVVSAVAEGSEMATSMRTDAEVTLMVTSEVSTPAALAIADWIAISLEGV